MRAGLANIHLHLEYIAYLFERRNWLAGEALSLADIAAAAQLSVLDYLGDVPWDRHPGAKLWYSRIKSRPSFRPLLADRLPGLKPARALRRPGFLSARTASCDPRPPLPGSPNGERCYADNKAHERWPGNDP